MRSGLTEPSTYILAGIALVLAGVAYARDPGLPWIGVKNGLSLLAFVAWEAPLMGWRFVSVRVLASLAFPVLAGWLVTLFHSD
jgi:hypothetical protein